MKNIDFTKITACGECCVGCKKKDDGLCEGCIESDGRCKEWAESGECPVHRCAKNHGEQFCGLCAEFPCEALPKKIHWNPNVVEHLTELANAYKKQTKNILVDFQEKIKINSLTTDDFLQNNFFPMFHNSYSNTFIKRIADCTNPTFEQGEDKFIYHIPLDDGWEVRLDFIFKNEKYKLANLDSYTLPLKKVDCLPFNTYLPLPDRESIMRQEYAITRTVDYYVRLKGIIGKQEALDWFKDGKGEKTGVPAWMPYFTKRKAFIAYTAWIQNRLYGENIYITKFSEEHSELLFKNSTWLFLYKVAGHLKHMIPYDEYIELFETIWKDRAICNDYIAKFSYENEDIIISFAITK